MVGNSSCHMEKFEMMLGNKNVVINSKKVTQEVIGSPYSNIREVSEQDTNHIVSN